MDKDELSKMEALKNWLGRWIAGNPRLTTKTINPNEAKFCFVGPPP